MAGKAIKGNEIVETGFLQAAKKEAQELTVELGKLDKGLKVIHKDTVKLMKLQKDPKTSEEVKKLNENLKKSQKARKGVLEVEKQQIAVKKQIKQLTVAEIKDKLKVQAQNKAIRDSLKDVIALENKQIGTLQKLGIENKRLRKERERLNLDTEKGRLRLKAINKQLDLNNRKITDNSDKLKKQRINVGNYSESIKEAASASGLFGSVLGPLAAIQGTLNALTKKNTIEQDANTVAKEINASATLHVTSVQKGMNVAMAAGTKGLRLFKIALASTGIGALLIAVGGLVAFFTRAQDGVDALSTKMAGLGAAVDVIIDRFSSVGQAFAAFFNGDFAEGVDLLKNAFKGVGEELAADVKLAEQLKALTIDLIRQQKLFEAQQATTVTRIKELTVVTKDKLAADQDRLKAVKEVNELEIGLTERLLELQEQDLAASLDAIAADGKSLGLQAQHLEFVERIKTGQIGVAEAVQQAADFTLSSAAGEEALFNIIDKVVQLEQERQNLLDKQATTAKRTASIVQQIANKNATAFLQQAAAQKELAKDVDASIEDRITSINKAAELETAAYRARYEANLINYAEFEAVRVKTNKIAEEAIQKLFLKIEADKLKARQAAEAARIKGLEDVAKDADAEVQSLETQLFRLESLKLQGVDKDQEIADKEFEIEKTKLENIKNSQLDSAEDIAQAQAEFDRFQIERAQKQADELTAIEAEKRKKTLDELSTITGATVTELDKRSQAQIKAIDDEISRNAKAITTQEQLAREGKQNQLAFEQAEADKFALQKREAEEKAARQEEILQLTQAYWGALNARLAQPDADPNLAPALAAKDIFLAKGIAKGLVQFAATGNEDVQGAGTTTSDSIPFMLSRNERVMTAEQNARVGGMSNEDLANLAFKYNSGMIEGVTQGGLDSLSKSPSFANIENSLMLQKQTETIGLLRAIKNKPVQQVDVDKLNNFIETVYSDGRKTVIKYANNRRRLS